MEKLTPPRCMVRFEDFEVDLAVEDLLRNSRKIKLQKQPFQTLLAFT